MNILNVLLKNFRQGSRTRKPADAVPYPKDFRGVLLHNVERCTACGTCVYACSPGAIQIDTSDPEISHWLYNEDQCTFCGFCVQYCPTKALSFQQVSPEPLADRKSHHRDHEIELKPCQNCGKPVHAVPEVTLRELYGDPLPFEIKETLGLCEHCRQELVVKRFLKTVVVKGEREDDRQ
jgi:hydrogenase-4 component H